MMEKQSAQKARPEDQENKSAAQDTKPVEAKSPSMTLDSRALQELRARFAGELITPADAGYAEARNVWNDMIDRRPALIARCASQTDVIAAVGFAHAQNLS